MTHRRTNGEVILDHDGAKGRKIGTENGCEYVHLTLQGGSTITAHHLDFPVTFYVLDGSGILTLDGNSDRIEPGDLVEVDAGALREWVNPGTEPFSCLVIKHVGKG
jgi:quercetin dioxygenase-like cupin family protein